MNIISSSVDMSPVYLEVVNPQQFIVAAGDTDTDVNDRMLDAMNSIRSGQGLPLFKTSNKLKEAARKHAEYMRDKVVFSHYGPGRKTWIDRANAAGYNSSSVGENIAFGQNSVDQTVKDWMGSDGHRIQILSRENIDVGSAVAFDPGGRGYWCTDFGFGFVNTNKMKREDFKFL